jgi:hypothetical protein
MHWDYPWLGSVNCCQARCLDCVRIESFGRSGKGCHSGAPISELFVAPEVGNLVDSLMLFVLSTIRRALDDVQWKRPRELILPEQDLPGSKFA